MNQKYNFIEKLATKLIPKFQIIELSLIAVIIATSTFNLFTKKSIDPVFTITIGLLSTLYFVMAFAINEEVMENTKATLVGKLSGLGLAVLLLGVLFSFNHIPRNGQMLFIGTATNLIIMIYTLFNKSDIIELRKFFRPIFIRSLIYGSIGIIVIMKQYQLIDF